MRLTNDESEVDNKLGRRIKWEEEEEELKLQGRGRVEEGAMIGVGVPIRSESMRITPSQYHVGMSGDAVDFILLNGSCLCAGKELPRVLDVLGTIGLPQATACTWNSVLRTSPLIRD
ncbi:hypothetical protein PCH_Pc20g03090 [Penicillium rubens Wisconsin 54-1255]|uniref:Uncharacterized protein n=1 Tax=Penicillium rubens (strain ATCC 28089 / DSM 1075 / NRRL 1951 / Wisconsin 54-1255) TaxID=500485 RepID=B6HFF1_PENRW|nr:hypothetical protein PCH_Pc20g03090 [Penicillium rubens Wisconsin 54-1255]